MIVKLVELTYLLSSRVRQLNSVARLKPFETSTLEGRSKERHRRIVLAALTSMVTKGVALLTMLISVPLTVGYLGAERYGLWMTISSVIAILVFADLGLGNGLLNAVSEANGRDDREAAREYVSSAFFMLSSITVALVAAFVTIYPWVPWRDLFNVYSPQAVAEVGPAMAVFFSCFALAIPLSVVDRVRMGYQEAYVNSFWTGAGNLLGLAGVLLAIYLKAGLPWLVLAMAGAPMLTSMLNGAMLFGRQRVWLRPRLYNVTSGAVGRVFRLGMLFLVLQIAVAVAYSSDNIIVAQVLGPEAVTQYSVPMRLFSVSSLILAVLLTPLWPAYGESIARGDVDWAQRALVSSVVVALFVAGIPSTFLVLFGAQVINLWVGPEVTPSFLLLLGLGVWTVIAAVGTAVGVFLNGANVIRFQVLTAALMAPSSLLAKILLAGVIGLPGIVWGMILAYLIFTAVPIAVYIPSALATLRARVVTVD